MTAPASVTVFIPLTVRKRNGRPKIVPPADMAPDNDGVDPHILRAIARAWSWRRRIEAGDAATIADLAAAEGISDRYVGRMLRLSFLAPAVLEKILIERMSPAVSLKDLASTADLPWPEQEIVIFARATLNSHRARGVPALSSGHDESQPKIP